MGIDLGLGILTLMQGSFERRSEMAADVAAKSKSVPAVMRRWDKEHVLR